jgi:hypothetical protein
MANQLVLGGRSTRDRLKEEWQRIQDSEERISVSEFARRTGISYHTLTHNYKDWAQKVRNFRDEGRARPRKKSPVTLSREQVIELGQAAEMITKLRGRIEELTKELNSIGANLRTDELCQTKTHLHFQLEALGTAAARTRTEKPSEARQ